MFRHFDESYISYSIKQGGVSIPQMVRQYIRTMFKPELADKDFDIMKVVCFDLTDNEVKLLADWLKNIVKTEQIKKEKV